MKTIEKTCYNCGKKMYTVDQYHWHDEFLGDFIIPCDNKEYSFCVCGEERLAYSLCLKIEKAEHDRISQAIMNMAHNNLHELEELVITGHDLEQIMKVSRQAICKNRKLKTLVFNFVFKGKVYYLRKSVMLFLEKGDGRFDLSQYVYTATDDKSATKRIGQTETADNVVGRLVSLGTGTSQSKDNIRSNFLIDVGSNWLQYNPRPIWQRYSNTL